MAYTFQERFVDIRDQLKSPVSVSLNDVPSGRSANWQPDPEEELLPDLNFYRKNVEWYDLDLLKPNQLMVLVLKGAIYGVRRVDEDRMKLWTSRGGQYKRPVPLLGSLANFGTIDTSVMAEQPRGNVDFYPKIAAVLDIPEMISHIDMPYFDFNPEGKLQQPRYVWRGSVQSIELGEIC